MVLFLSWLLKVKVWLMILYVLLIHDIASSRVKHWPCSIWHCTCVCYSSSSCCRHGCRGTLHPCPGRHTASPRSSAHTGSSPGCSWCKEDTHQGDTLTHRCGSHLEQGKNTNTCFDPPCNKYWLNWCILHRKLCKLCRKFNARYGWDLDHGNLSSNIWY